MTVTDVVQDAEALTLTVTAEFTAAVERVWQIWADPRLLERWWGPPSYPATVVEHDLRPGGRVSYYMTGPEGEKYPGWWEVTAVDAPRSLDFQDGFADDGGTPDPNMPVTTTHVEIVDAGNGSSRMTLVSKSGSLEAMQKLLDMGMVEGFTTAVAQIDDLLPA